MGEPSDPWTRSIMERDNRIAALKRENERVRELLDRAYDKLMKPHWEEGKCWQEVAADVEWEGARRQKALRDAARGESDG